MQADFKAAPTKCEQCHEDIHGGQFAGASKITPCATCHNSFQWKPSLFDHERRTSFSLKGAHQNLSCEACHKNVQMVSGKSVLFYKPTPKKLRGVPGAAPVEVTGTDGVELAAGGSTPVPGTPRMGNMSSSRLPRFGWAKVPP